MTNVGEVTGSRTPSPAPIPWVSAVLPAPSGPTRTTRSPGRSTSARARPSAWVSSGAGSRWSRFTVGPPSRASAASCRRSASRAARGAPFGPEPDGRRRVVGDVEDAAVPVCGPRLAGAGEHGPGPEEPLGRRQPQRHDDRRVEQLELPAQPAAAAGHLRRLRRPVARWPALHDVQHRRLGAGRDPPRRAAGRAVPRTGRRTAGRSRPPWPRAPPRPARTAAGRPRARHRRRRAAGPRPARGRPRTGGPRRRGSPSRARRRRRGPPRRRSRRSRGGRGAATSAP